MSQSSHNHKKQLSPFVVVLFMLTSALCSSCSSDSNESAWKHGDLMTILVGEIPVQIELAISEQEKAKGLMHRKEMPADQGMLFIFKNAERRSFWMKNTFIPLDIAYIDSSGVIREIHHMYPNNRNSVPSYSDQIQYALEMNQGWFKANSIQPGAKIELEKVLKNASSL